MPRTNQSTSRAVARFAGLLAAMVLMGFAQGARADYSTLDVSPSTAFLNIGDTETFSLVFTPNADYTIDAAQFAVQYDPNMLQLVKDTVQLGDFFPSDGTFLLTSNTNNDGYFTSEIDYNGQSGPGVPAIHNQRVTLLTFSLKAIGSGVSQVELVSKIGNLYTSVFDASIADIPLAPFGSSTVTVAAVPEPGSIALICLGGFGLVAGIRARSRSRA